MGERVLRGAPASPGLAIGRARVLALPRRIPREQLPAAQPPAEAERAIAALRRRPPSSRARRADARHGPRGRGGDHRDRRADGRRPAARAGGGRGGARARPLRAPRRWWRPPAGTPTLIAALPDPHLAARADDVRSLARRAARIAAGTGGGDAESNGAAYVLVAEDLGPADVAELGEQAEAIALAAGGVTAHAAIVARSLGIPMAVGLGGGCSTPSPARSSWWTAARARCARPRARAGGRGRRAAEERRAARARDPTASFRPSRSTATWCTCW